MKYLYFDCFAGIDPFMILGSLADMKKDAKHMEKHFLPGVTLSFGEEKIMGMDAMKVHLLSEYPSKTVCAKEIETLIESMSLLPECEKFLKKYVSILKDVSSFEPDNAEFDLFEESLNISALCAIWNETKNLGIEKIYVSPVFTSSEEGLFGPYTKKETVCISKKYATQIRYAKEYEEIFSPGAASMLASLKAESVTGFVPSSVIEIGYGAGGNELQTLANVLRTVIGEDFSDSLMFAGEEISLGFSQSLDFAGMKES